MINLYILTTHISENKFPFSMACGTCKDFTNPISYLGTFHHQKTILRLSLSFEYTAMP